MHTRHTANLFHRILFLIGRIQGTVGNVCADTRYQSDIQASTGKIKRDIRAQIQIRIQFLSLPGVKEQMILLIRTQGIVNGRMGIDL